MDVTEQLVQQLDWHWTNQLRPRLAGLSDAEYFWEPVEGAWNVRPRVADADAPGPQPGSGPMTVDFTFPQPEPPPVTTIAWRLAHIIVGCLGIRNASHFGGPACSYDHFPYAASADEALAQLDSAYAGWLAGVRGLDEAALAEPCGPAEAPWSDLPMAALVMHINREVIHHGAEIALLRDLWAHR